MELTCVSTDPKVVLIGDNGSGKTSIIVQLIQSVYKEDIEPTVGTSFAPIEIATSLGSILLRIWDTAGAERFRSLTPIYTRNSTAAIIVVDHTSSRAFLAANYWGEFVAESCPPECLVYFAINKIDLPMSSQVQDLKKWAEQQKFTVFLVSAKQRDTVAEMFKKIATDILSRRGQQPDSQAESVAGVSKRNSDSSCC